MIEDIQCPYCDHWQEVNHDDGRNYEQDVPHEMVCESCEKRFIFYTEISFSYQAQKADCLNGQDHDWVPTKTFPKEFTQMQCNHCHERRDPSNHERAQFGLGSKEDYFIQLQKEA